MMWVFLCPQESEGRTWMKSLPGYPGKVPPGKHSSVCCPGKVSLAATAGKKIKYFLPSCCDLIKMYYLCTSNKSNNLNF